MCGLVFQRCQSLLADCFSRRFIHVLPVKREKNSAPQRHARPPLERMLRIHRAIQSGSHPNTTSLAVELEVSSKSIQRDLEFMRDRLELPLVYVPDRFGYVYTEEVSSFPTLQITEGELFSLLIAEKALQQYRGTNFEKPLMSAFKKMAAVLPDTISLNLADWEQTISFHIRAEPLINLETFNKLAHATARRQQLILDYRKPGSKTVEQRVVDPFHLANINGEWFLFAFCHLRQDIRTFVPARMVEVKMTGKTIKRPAGFSLSRHLRDSFGVHTGQGNYLVTVHFKGFAADYIREKKWHPSQKLREISDGCVELSLNLSSLIEVQRWILSWGANAEVIEPVELKEMIIQSARKVLNQYSS
jgi:proteasome accessory factor B